MRNPRSPFGLGVLLACALVGCNSGSRSSSTGAGAPPGTNPPPAATPALVYSSVALVTSQQAQRIPSQLTAMVFTLQAANAAVVVERVDVDASGTVDETTLGAASLIDDANGSGDVDAGEATLATAPAPASDNGRYSFTLTSPLTVAAGTTQQLIVSLDASGLLGSTATVGSTVVLGVTAAASIDAHDTGAPPLAVVPTGVFGPATPGVTLGMNTHLLISELFIDGLPSPTNGEFVELYNPTGASIDLTNVFLTDYTSGNLNVAYFRLPEGTNFGPVQAGSSGSDWLVRFPAGATIAPGQVITIALDGTGYSGTWGSDADYCMRAKGATTSNQMLTWDGTVGAVNFTAADVGGNAGLTDTSESVFLYTWDPANATDLIVDLDIVNYGAFSPTNYPVDKGGVSTDTAFDADLATSMYEPETVDFDQAALAADQTNSANSATRSIQRVDFSEGVETRTPGTGNGTGDHDETSEDLNVTFDVLTPTPGQVP